jgi:hypothetical protein
LALCWADFLNSLAFASKLSTQKDLKMNVMKTAIVMMCMASLSALASAQAAPAVPAAAPVRISAADAKKHLHETVTVCGKVVDTKIPRYGLAGHGKPVWFFLDQPEPNSVFFFFAFGTKDGGPQEAIDAYKGKNVCVTGVIQQPAGNSPCIFIADRSTIKVEPDAK